jgi:adenylosuccinate synthase
MEEFKADTNMSRKSLDPIKTLPVMVIDGQWGSTGKGLIAGYLAQKKKPKAVVSNFGPNAGHTFKTRTQKIVTSILPTSGVVGNTVERIFLGPGSAVDLKLLFSEMRQYAGWMAGKQVIIHERATCITLEHKRREVRDLSRIASTMKGTGAAMAAKVMREEDAIVGYQQSYITEEYCGVTVRVVDGWEYAQLLGPYIERGSLIIESAQGLELGINSGSHYPHCTGREVTPNQILSDCGITTPIKMCTVMTMRTYPIRVGNEPGTVAKGHGYSGDVYPDQREINYVKDLGIDPETTTVTGKVRRVFTWSDRNLRKAMDMVNPDFIFLNFINYLTKEREPDFKTKEVRQLVDSIPGGQDRVRWAGRGPLNIDVIESPTWKEE